MERRTFTFEQQKTQLDFIVQGNEFLIWYDTIIIIKVHQNLWDLFQLTHSQTVNKVKKSLRPWPLLKLVAVHLNLRAVLFDVVDDTTTAKFTSRACAVHCNSLPVVVDKVRSSWFLSSLKLQARRGRFWPTHVNRKWTVLKLCYDYLDWSANKKIL